MSSVSSDDSEKSRNAVPIRCTPNLSRSGVTTTLPFKYVPKMRVNVNFAHFPFQIADKVKLFYTAYARNRHKM